MRRITLLTICALLLCWIGGAKADLVGYWPLDGDATDASGNGNDGTITGNVTPTADRFGNPDGAMSFGGGANDKIDLGTGPDLQITGEMTLAAWVLLRDGNPNNGRVIAKAGGGGQRCWSLNTELLSGGVANPATFQIARDANTNLSVLDTQSLPTDEWVHMAGVFRPDEAIEIYVNGELRISNTTSIPAQQHNNSLAVLIGNRAGANNCGWYGSIDEVRVYNEALSQAQISSIMRTLSACNPNPANRAERVPVNPILSWDAPDPEWLADPNAADEVQYVVYFDPNELLVSNRDASVRFGPQYETGFAPTPPDLELATTYYWLVDVIDPNFGQPVTYPGRVWTFTTLPPKAGLIYPDYGAVNVERNAVLQWDAGFGAVAHDIYFGTDGDLVAAGDASVYVGRTVETSYDPDLDWQTQYFWRIDEVFSGGGLAELGDVWRFTTAAAVCEYELDGDINKDCIVDFQDLALMAENWLICNLTNGDCP